MEEVLDGELEGPPEASVVKVPTERLNREKVVRMMIESIEPLTFEYVFFSAGVPEFQSYGFVE